MTLSIIEAIISIPEKRYPHLLLKHDSVSVVELSMQRNSLFLEVYRGYALKVAPHQRCFRFEWQDNQGNSISDWKKYRSLKLAVRAGRYFIDHAIAESALAEFLEEMLHRGKVSSEEYFLLQDSLL